jgi:bifunctional N-acetylglucosamine-1-phosphate-uridyltransferase/glucosamine-1-phosphate-acetyltransferase GlmU-like protein
MTGVETKTHAIKVAVDVDPKSVFAIVLLPHGLIDAEICGRKASDWVTNAVAAYKHARVEIKRGEDIVSVVGHTLLLGKDAEHAKHFKYCVVVYGDTPLVTAETIEQCLSFTATYGHKVVQLPRGWVFDIDFIKNANSVDPTVMPNIKDDEFLVTYNYAQIALATSYLRQRINETHMNNGVQITDPYNVYIDADAKIGAGTKIGPGVIIRGATEIGKGCKLTNYVEVKKSVIGDGTKIAHMSYIGDAEVGKNCNIGCGVVFCNYDGKEKHKTTVGDNVFMGSNTNLVAPVTVGNNAFIGAGSTITADVPARALAIARARQAVKEEYNPNAE